MLAKAALRRGMRREHAELGVAARMSQVTAVVEVQDVTGVFSETAKWFNVVVLAVHELRLSAGAGDHLMRAWPTSY